MGWHAPRKPAVRALLDDPKRPLNREMLSTSLRQILEAYPDVMFAEPVRRRAAALEQIVWMAIESAEGTNTSAQLPSFADTLGTLSELQLLAEIITSYQLSRFLDSDPRPGHARTSVFEHVDNLVASNSELRRFRVATPMSDIDWQRLAGWEVQVDNGSGHTLGRELDERLWRAVRQLPDIGGVRGSADLQMACALLRAVVSRRGDEFPSEPYDNPWLSSIADALLPIHADPATSLQHIDFFRVAGDAQSPASDARNKAVQDRGLDGKVGNKIAGKQLNHLGAFFAPEWRANDWQWGQLDAVPTLIDAIVDDAAFDSLTGNSAALKNLGLEGRALDRASLKEALVDLRQQQIINGFLAARGTPVPSTEKERAREFSDWATQDRRVISLLGKYRLSGIGMRGILTTSKVMPHRSPWMLRRLVDGLVRPLAMGIGGVFLCGRWGAAALAWTIGALATPRAGSTTARWALFVASVAVTGFALYQSVIKPKVPLGKDWVHGRLPYLLAIAGLGVSGASLIDSVYRWLREPQPFLLADIPPGVWLAGIAAAVSAACISWWLHRLWFGLFVVVIFCWYFLVARAGYLHGRNIEANTADVWWPNWWPLRRLWTGWLIAVIGSPWAFTAFDRNQLGGKPLPKPTPAD